MGYDDRTMSLLLSIHDDLIGGLLYDRSGVGYCTCQVRRIVHMA